MNIRFASFLLFVLMLCCVSAEAQRTPIRGGGNIKRDTSRNTLRNIIRKPDTLKVNIFYAAHPERLLPYPDTMLGYDFQQSDPTRQQDVDWIHLGSLGTPARPLLFNVRERTGLNLGFNQFDLYQRGVEDIRYFKVNRTFTDTYYAQNHTKDDFYFKGNFARDLNPNLTVNTDYDRISHEGIFTRQKSRHTIVSFNLAYRTKNNRYKSFASYTYNDMQQQDNGGIVSVSDFSNPLLSDRVNIPVVSSSAETRMQQTHFAYTHYYNLLSDNKNDSIPQPPRKRSFTVGHQFVYSPGEYKFFDSNPDSSFYKNYQVDDRGLRQYMTWDKLENKVQLSTFKLEEGKDAPRDLYAAGLFHIYQKTYQEPRDTSINSVYLFGEWDFNPARFISLNAYAQYGIGSNSNEYLIRGNLKLDLGKVGIVRGHILNQRFSPDLIQSRMFISERQVFENDFVKPITTSIKASYEQPLSKTQISVHYHLLNNHIYYDTLSLPQQSASGISVLQLIAQQDIRFGVFGMENTIVFQTDNSDFIRMPTIFMKNSLFAEGQVFKRVMLARIGFDFRMNTNYLADAYMPVTGQFHNQDLGNVALYPALDFFLNFKVQTFRGFLKMENITGWFTDQVFFQTPNHPLADPHFRFGVSWRFID